MEYEMFVGRLRTGGNDNIEVTIPQHLCKYAGYGVGDIVKIMIKKIDLEDKEE